MLVMITPGSMFTTRMPNAADRSKIIRLEDLMVLVLGHELERGGAADTRVVHQHIDRPVLAHRLEGARDRVRRGDVELDHLDRQPVFGRRVAHRPRLGGIAQAREHLIAPPRELQRSGEPDPAAGSRDDRDPRHLHPTSILIWSAGYHKPVE
jgi:hypothetical protein